MYESKGFTLKSKGSSSKRGAEFAGACPGCGGEDRFCIWPEQNNGQGSYSCRGCECAGDAIQFLIDFEGMRFGEAQKAITGENAYTPKKTVYTQKAEKKNIIEAKECTVPVSEKWEEKATKFQNFCLEQLEANPVVVEALAARGIALEVAKHYGIGYHPGEKGKNSAIRHRTGWGLDVIPASGHSKEKKYLWLPRGIVVPVCENGQTKRLRIRRDDIDREEFQANMKYYVVPGSDMSPLYLPSTNKFVPDNFCTLIVEGELDAYMLHSKVGDFCSVMSIMTAKITALPPALMDKLKKAAIILVATDKDDNRAGFEGWEKWQATFAKAKRLVPLGAKDPGDMFAKGEDLVLWVLGALPSVYANGILKKVMSSPNETAKVETAKGETEAKEDLPDKSKTPLDSFQPSFVHTSKRDIENDKSHKRFLKQFFKLDGVYVGNFNFIEILDAHGLTVNLKGDDFNVTGHEKWKDDDWMKLFWFTRKHSEAIINQLKQREEVMA